MIYSAVGKKDENGQDVDLEIKFNVDDLRRVLELVDSDDDPTIIPERLCQGLWCRMGFIGRLNGKMGKTMFSKTYKFMIHYVVHALSHRKGAYDETSDYIMNSITSLVLNRPYNVSKVIFSYLVENVGAGSTKYIVYTRFIMMMIDDLVKHIQKDDDVLALRNMTTDTISRLAKGPEPRVRRMICIINNLAYVAPENDAWRHDNSISENENDKMSEMVEKKTHWWFVKDGKRKRIPKTSPIVPIPKKPTPKIVVKGLVKGGVIRRRPSKQPQQRLVDEHVLDPSEVLQKGADLLKQSLESYLKRNGEVAAQKDQSTSVPTEIFKETEPEDVARDEFDDADDESTETETELDLATLDRGKAQLKKKPTKKKKGSDEEDTTYTPSVVETKKLRIKRKTVQTGVIPRNVRARKGGASMPESQSGKSEKHVMSSKVHEAEKVQHVEDPKEPHVQNVEKPEAEVQKNVFDDDYVEVRDATPSPPPKDQTIPEIGESSHQKKTSLPDMFEGFPNIRGELKDDFVLGDDFDMFHDANFKELKKKVGILEQENVKA
ncbi:hypothetical protein Hanom_Chr03g00198081 [Helianthus anomalus]